MADQPTSQRTVLGPKLFSTMNNEIQIFSDEATLNTVRCADDITVVLRYGSLRFQAIYHHHSMLLNHTDDTNVSLPPIGYVDNTAAETNNVEEWFDWIMYRCRLTLPRKRIV